jgi:hypothetical protein
LATIHRLDPRAAGLSKIFLGGHILATRRRIFPTTLKLVARSRPVHHLLVIATKSREFHNPRLPETEGHADFQGCEQTLLGIEPI